MTKAMTPIERARELLEHPGAGDAKGTMVVPADDVATVCRALIAAEERAQEFERALEAHGTALEDWLNTYAADMCDKKDVRESSERIYEHGGTLAYIAELREQRSALANGKEESPDRHAPGCLAAPGTMNDDLLGRLREAASAIALCPQMETRHGETCDLAYERIDALKAALRKHCVDNHMCHECNTFWERVGDERHAPGCLAAPEDAP